MRVNFRHLLFLLLGLFIFITEAPAFANTSDDFSYPTLNTSLWTAINPRSDATFTIEGTGTADSVLSINVPAGSEHDVWAGNMAPRVMQTTANTDLEVEVKFQAPLVSPYQIQGVIVEQDINNFIRFDFVRDNLGTKVFAASFSNGSPSSRLSVRIVSGNPLYLRVNRLGNQWTELYSYNGTSWTTAGSFSHTLTVAKIGPYAGNAGNPAPAFTSMIDYFFNTASPIAPEDGGDTVAPVFNIWYGPDQLFGYNGIPQAWVNILGNVSDFSGIAALSYRLNGGLQVPLFVGPDGKRVQSAGDFNIDIAYSALSCGANTVDISATDTAGNIATERVNVFYYCNTYWPRTYSIDWSTVTNIQDVAQVVDGYWSLNAGSVRPVVLGYDRLIAIGDIDPTWNDYEVTVPITINTPLNSSVPYGPLFGVVVRWQGHYDWDGTQPRWGWWPLGAMGIYDWVPQISDYRLRIIGNREDPIADDLSGRHLSVGVPYIFKMRVETVGAASVYSLKVWESGTPEPSGWNVRGQGINGELRYGSLMLITHYSDVSFGNVSVTPGPFADDVTPPAISGIAVTADANSARITWTTDELASGNVAYGFTEAYENGSIQSSAMVTTRTITLTDLSSQSTYHFRITSADAYGNSSSSTDLTFTTTSDQSRIISDDFSGSSLNTTLWNIINPGNDATVSLVGTGTADAHLSINIPAGASHDVWSGNMAPRVMQAAGNADFDVEIKFDSVLTSPYQIQGIIVEQDSNNFIRFDFVRDNLGTKVFAARVLNGSPSARLDVRITNGSPLYLRVKRVGDLWTESYSNDGVNWTVAGSFIHPLTVRSIGPFAGNAGGTAPAFNCLIDYFFNRNFPIILEDSSPPVIVTQPQSLSVPTAEPAAFTLTAIGKGTLSYQWKKNGTDIPGANAPSYSIPVTSLADNGSDFRCVVTNSEGSTTSSVAVLTVSDVAPAITGQPSSQTVAAGQTATFGVTATGTMPMSYQWQINGIDIPGANSTSYTTPVTTELDSGTTYRCIITNTAGSTMSSGATLSVVILAPVITRQPSAAIVAEGQVGRFTVEASGSPTLSYQWQKNGLDIPGANSPSYTTPPVTQPDSGAGFRCVVTNSAGSVTSNEGILSVTNIVSDDFSGSEINNSVWTVINPRGDATFTLAGTGTSNALLSINVPAGVSHDVWSGNMAPRIMQTAGNTDLEIEVKFESDLTAQYQIQGIIVEQDSSNYLRLDIVRDATGTRAFAASFINGAGSVKLNVPINNGNPLYLRVKRVGDQWTHSYSYDGVNWTVAGTFSHTMIVRSVGPFAGNLGSPAPDFTCLIDYFFSTATPVFPEDTSPPVITLQPVNKTVSSGQTVTFNVNARGMFPLSYQWQKNGVDIPGATGTSYSTSPAMLADDGTTFQCVITNPVGVVTSNTVRLTVESIVSDDFRGASLNSDLWTFINPRGDATLEMTGTNLLISVPQGTSHDVWNGGNFAPRIMQPARNEDFEIEVKFESGVTGRNVMEGIIVEQDSNNYLRFDFFSDGTSTRIYGATFTSGTPATKINNVLGGLPGPTPTYMRINRAGSQWTQSYSYDGAVWTTAGSFTHSLAVASVGVFIGNAMNNPAFTGSVDYFFDTSSPIVPEDGIPPSIYAQPADRVVTEGQTATFTVIATGMTPLSYQWRMNGVDIPGATGPSYTTPPTIAADHGAKFLCVITNPMGSVTSNEVTLTIEGFIPAISSHPSDATVYEGNINTFNVVATGREPLVYQWKRNGADIPGANTASYTTPAATFDDSGSVFHCTVTNAYGVAISNTATMTVTMAPPVITTQPVDQTVLDGQTATFTAAAAGTVPLTYQWQKNGVDIPGENGLSYTTPVATAADSGSSYRIVVTNPAGTAVSNAAILIIASAPAITKQPLSQTVTEGFSATFRIEAVGVEPMTYQWQKNGINLAGANSSTYTTPATKTLDNGSRFSCIITNVAGSTVSTAATLTVSNIVSDDFSASGFNTDLWTFINPLNDATVTMTGTNLRISVPAGVSHDAWTSNKAPRIMQPAKNRDFEIEVKFESPLSGKNVIQGVIVEQTSTNYLRFDFFSDGLKTRIFAASLVNGYASVKRNLAIGELPSNVPIYLKIKRVGNQWTESYSFNGTTWSQAVSFSHTMTVTAVGAFAGNAADNPAFTASIDYFFNTAYPINPEDQAAPVMTSQPVDQVVIEGQTATFNVSATGATPMTFQWQKNGLAISGATGLSYTTPATVLADNGAVYRAVVTNALGSVSSNTATLTVNGIAPTVAAHPLNSTSVAGETASFSVTASGSAPLSYQWKKNGADIPGATTASYTTPATISEDNGAVFQCIVTNAFGNSASNGAVLTIVETPVIVSHPSNQTVIAGQTGTFSVNAIGVAPMTFQWQKNGVDIPGANGPFYTTPGTVLSDGGSIFRCVVTNGYGNAVSNGAMLTVMMAPVVTQNPSATTIESGQTATFTVEVTGTMPMSYQWQKNGQNIPGATNASYTTPAQTQAADGSMFRCVVSNLVGEAVSGSAMLTVTGAPPVITVNPMNQTVVQGKPVTFNVVATGSSLTYQWQRNGVDISGANSASYTISKTVLTDSGSTFRCVVTNTIGSAVSSNGALTVATGLIVNPGFESGTSPWYFYTNGAGTFQSITPGFESTKAGRVSITTAGTNVQLQQSGLVLEANTQYRLSFKAYSNTGHDVAVTVQKHVSPYTIYGLNNYQFNLTTSWSTYTVQFTTANFTGTVTDGRLMFWLAPYDANSDQYFFDDVLLEKVYSGPPVVTTHPSSLTVGLGQTATFTAGATGTTPLSYQWLKNGVPVSGATTATYTTPATVLSDEGASFRCVVFNAGGNTISNAAILSLSVPPSIITQPRDKTVGEGQTATFTVEAIGTAPLTYQWQKNGVNIAGATSASYTTPSNTLSDIGTAYRCVVTNSLGSAISNPATVTVSSTAPTISVHPFNRNIIEGQTATFSVTASGTAPLLYQWQKNGVDIAGANSSSYTTPPAVLADSSSIFRCVIINSAGGVTSNGARLTVNGIAPVVTANPADALVAVGKTATFTVEAAGSAPLSYQWQKDGVIIPDATGPSYTTMPATLSDNGAAYRCVVSNTVASATSNAAMLTVSSIISDDFNSPALNASLWNVINPRNDASFTITGSGTKEAMLSIQVPAGTSHDVWITNMAPRVMQSVSNTDFETEVKFQSELTNRYQIQGIIVEQDNKNFIRFDFVMDGYDTRAFATSFADSVPTIQSDIPISPGNPLYLKVKRTGDQWTQSYSYDGIVWGVVATFTHTMTVASIGPFAGNSGNPAPAFTGLIDYFFNTASPLVPEDSNPPFIFLHPVDMTLSAGQTATFTVSATGTAPLSYQWQKDGVDIPGANSASYTTLPLTPGDSGSIYRCRVVNPDGSSISMPALLTVGDFPPAVISQPSDRTIIEAQTATFTISASGTLPLLYQWQKDGIDIAGANNASYTIPPATMADNGAAFNCVVTNSFGTVTSNAAMLTVATAPIMMLHPVDQSISEGQTATFIMSAAGTEPLSYQWQKDGVNIAGANSSSYTTPLATMSDNGAAFRCVVQNLFGTATSNNGILTVNGVPPAIAGQVAGQTVSDGQTATFVIVATGTAPLSYQWQKNGMDIMGANSPSYTTPPATMADNGAIFRCLVTSPYGSAASSEATLTVNMVGPVITAQPVTQMVTVGQTATYAVGVSGSEPLSYQWQQNGIDIPGANSPSYTTPLTTMADYGTIFRCVVTNPVGMATSSDAVLIVTDIVSDDFNRPEIDTTLWRFVNPRNDATFSIIGAGTPDAFLAISVPAGTEHDIWAGNMAPRVMQTVSNTDFEIELKFESVLASQYQIQGIIIEQDNANFIRLDIVKEATRVKAFAASFSNGVPSVRTSVTMNSGNPVYLRVKRVGNQWTQSYSHDRVNWTTAGSFSHALTVTSVGPFAGNAGNPAPAFTALVDYIFNTSSPIDPEDASPASIILGPSDQTVATGWAATFSVTATGTPPLVYQWQRDGADIAGANSPSFTIPSAAMTDSGSVYHCIVSNYLGTAFSNDALLTVSEQSPVIILQPVSQSIDEGRTVTFSVSATGSLPLTYQWQRNGVDIEGATGTSFTIQTVLDDSGSIFRSVVTNPFGTVVSNPATLTVIGVPPSIVAHPANVSVPVGQSATFRVNVAGSPPMSYQWKKNGANIPGATDSSYTTPPTIPSDNGTLFSCVITNAFGAVMSNQASVSVRNWWNSEWGFRVPVTVGAAGYERFDKPVEAAVNFTQMLSTFGQTGSFDEKTIRVVEVDSQGNVIKADIPYQFDKDPDYDASTKASGTVVFLMEGTTAANATRRYQIFFDLTGHYFAAPPVNPLVSITENIFDEGQESYRIQAMGSTYYYHIMGGGFSSWLDANGNDWISYNPVPGSGAAGEFRGIPNMAYVPNGYSNSHFHPGFTNARSTIVSQGPLKVRIRTISNEGKWESLWDIYPTYATMTLLRKAETNYWFLYEGTPGGSLETGTDFVVRSNGSQTPLSETWSSDIPTTEWTYFGDPNINRSLFVAKHEDDTAEDSYWTMGDEGANMTVLGYGRQANKSVTLLSTVPAHFTIGLMDTTEFSMSSKTIYSAYKDLSVTIGSADQVRSDLPHISVQPANQTAGEGKVATFNITATGNGPLSYQWQRNGVDISGANGPSYTTPQLTPGDDGEIFRCLVWNSTGSSSVFSEPALLSVVNLPVIISQPLNQTAAEGRIATFSVAAAGKDLLSYQWQKNGVNIPGANLSSYSTPPATVADNGSIYRCIITNQAGSITSAAALLTVGNIVSDDFSAPVLNAGIWTFVNPRGDARLTMTGTNLTLYVPGSISHDVWYGGNFAPRIMQPARDTNFEIDVKFSSGVSGKNMMQGIIVEQDSNNYIRFDFSSDGTFLKTYSASFIAGVPSARINNLIGGTPSVSPLYMRVKRTGNIWMLLYSYDGMVWTASGSFNHTLTVSSVGVFAGNAVNNPALTASIDYFFNSGSPVTSEDGTAPVITLQPLSRTVAEGQAAIFAVVTEGSGPIYYQWQKNGVNIAGETSSSYTISSASLADSGALFRCIVMNRFGAVVSSTAGLAVTVAPYITSHPSDRLVFEGEAATFMVSAVGAGQLSYQWQRDGADIPGATGPSYVLPVVTPADGGASFRVIVTNYAGTAVSNPAYLRLKLAPQILTHPSDQTVEEGLSATFSIDATGTIPLFYQWQRNGVDIPGATGPSYTTPPVTTSINGSFFRCMVTNEAGNVTSNPAMLTVSPTAPGVTVQPQGVTVQEGQTASFSTVVTGTSPLTYQWQKNGVDIPGANSPSYTTPVTVLSHSGTSYRCLVTNSVGSVMTNYAALTVNGGLIANPGFESGTSPWSFYTDAAGTFNNNAPGNGSTLAGHISITTQGTNVQLRQSGVVLEANTIYRLTFDAYSNSGHDLSVAVQKDVSPFTNYGLMSWTADLTSLWKTFSIDFTTTGFTGTISDGRLLFNLSAYDANGDHYYIDNVILKKVSSGSPIITTHPANRITGLGQTATFSIAVTGASPMTYQWLHNNIPIPGATAPSYTTGATAMTDDGSTFRVVISNAYGSTVSNPASLTITVAPVISVPPGNQVLLEGQLATFSIEAIGVGPFSYQWQKNSVNIPGANEPIYTTPATMLADNGATYRCIVTNLAGSIASSAAVLNVKDPLAQLLVLDVRHTHSTTTGNGFAFFPVPANIPENLVYPVNYAGGTLYQRVEVITKPTDKTVLYQICAHQNEISHYQHTCSQALGLSFTTPGVYYNSISMPLLYNYNNMDWWSRFYKLMLVVRDSAFNPVDDQVMFAGLWDGSPDFSLYFPMEVRYTAIIVPPGGGPPVWP